MKIEPPLETTATLVYAALQEKGRKEKPRSHLGASVIGHKCERWIWLSFRWAVREDFEGRILRLFRRGQDEENYVYKDLDAAGLHVQPVDPNTGKQFNFAEGFFAGSMDGIIRSGVPEAPKAPHILEIKTHSVKSFDALVKDGVKKSKPQHYDQMQTYMRYRLPINRALYFAVCKDDDRIYTERIDYDAKHAEKLREKAHRIIAMHRPPEKISEDATWFECKYCAAHDLCHVGKITKHANCRTCCHFTATPEGKAMCSHWESEIPTLDAQIAGCECHLLHPDLTPWEAESTERGTLIFHTTEGPIENGEPDANIYASTEILANWKACAKQDEFMRGMREEMGARVTG